MLLLCRAPMEDGSLAPSLAPTVSILVPCFQAAATIGKAVGSALAQTFDDIEVVLASDDGEDYAALSGCADPRLRQVSTGRAGSGDGPARNAALAAARGRFVANLDADDTMRPERLAFMLPFAERCGAALDNTALWIDGRLAKTAFPPAPADFRLTVDAILAPRLPMNALLRRELAGAGWRAFDFCSDVVFNLEVLSRCPEFRGLARTGYDYAKRGRLDHPGAGHGRPGGARLCRNHRRHRRRRPRPHARNRRRRPPGIRGQRPCERSLPGGAAGRQSREPGSLAGVMTVVLVTGAARRIGRHLALAFGRAGCSVGIHYNGSRREAETLAARVERGGSAARRPCGVGRRRSPGRRLRSRARAGGRAHQLRLHLRV